MSKITKYFGGVVKEGKKVRWPKSDVFWPAIGVVLCITAFAALALFLDDMLVAKIIAILEEAFSSMK